MRQAETLPSRILIERLSGLEGDPIWVQFMRPEVRLQLSYQQGVSEMRADLPLEHHEDHRDWQRTRSQTTEEAIRGANRQGREDCAIERSNVTQLPDGGKAKGWGRGDQANNDLLRFSHSILLSRILVTG